jgi:hypothetical protein
MKQPQTKSKKIILIMKQTRFLTCAAALTFMAAIACAEEGGSGHYAPGSTASFVDALPGKPGLVIANAFTYYYGSATPPIDFAGDTVINASATLYADSLFALYETPLRILGGNYAVATIIPYVWLTVDGDVRHGPLNPKVSSSTDGLGDIMLYPFILGWTNSMDMKYDVRLGIYAPTGGYEKGRLANAGRNYWTFEPAVSFSWLSTKIGTEVTVFTGFDVNTRNDDTDYQSGASYHLDGTVAQHLPLFGGFAGVGAEGFVYYQISADSGGGDNLGGFEGRTIGVGPVVSYAHKIGSLDFAGEVKWLPEVDVQNRLSGDYLWVKLGIVF